VKDKPALKFAVRPATGPGNSPAVADSLGELYRPIRPGLERAARVLDRVITESDHFIRPMARHLLRCPGKRIRAALVLFSARAGRADPRRAAELAAAVEMLHTASLIHDDIMDGALLRRGQRALHREWGTKLSVLMGDYLFTWNLNMLSRRYPSRLVRRLIDASRSLCDGEIEEAALAYRRDVGMERYLGIIGKKTAALMEAACEAGAVLAGVPDRARDGLARYGRAFGMAFQLVDDAMDFTGDEREAGKTLGSDMAEGRFTMPVLSLLRHLKGGSGERFRRLLSRPSLSNGGARRAAAMVIEYGGVARTLELARIYTGEAVAAIRGVPAAARVPLETLAELALRRRA